MKVLSVKLLLIIIVSIVFRINGFSQDCLWSSHAGGTAYDGGGNVVCDKKGNTYITGVTESSPCYFNTDTLNSSSFIVKYNKSGEEVWILDFLIGNGQNDGETGVLNLTIDTTQDELLSTGSFYNYLVLPDTVLHGSKNTIFILKIDLNGNIIWHRTAGGAGDDQAFDITSDPNGNIYICGSNESNATFGQITIPRGGFLAKYDANGNVIWAKNKFRFFNNWGSGSGYPFTEAEPLNLLYTSNSLFVNGNIQNDTVIVDSTTIINDYGFMSSYLASFSSQGDLQWIKPAGGPQGECGMHFATDNLNHIFITGGYTRVGIFDNDTLKHYGSHEDCFLAKYDNNGNLLWVTSPQSSTAYGCAVASSTDGDVYLSGIFGGTAYFGKNIITSSSSSDMFLAKYSAEGISLGVRQYSSGGLYGLALDASKNICLVGMFNNTLSIGPNTFVSRGMSDLFVAKCSPIIGDVENLKVGSNQLLIYANPNSGICSIDIPDDFKHEKSLTLTIFNSQGNVIEKAPIEITDEKISLNIQAQAAGMYNVILTNGKKSYSGKIIFK